MKKDEYQLMKSDINKYQKYLLSQSEYRAKYKIQREIERKNKIDTILYGKNYKEYNGYYVTDEGIIYSKTCKILKGNLYNGYRFYNIKSKIKSGHRIVWETFVGEIPDGYEIDHINGNRDDNRLTNLKLVTHKENCNNPLTITNYKKSNKTAHCKEIIQIFPDGTKKEWPSAVEVQRQLGYYQSGISLCLRGKVKSYKGSKWIYNKKSCL